MLVKIFVNPSLLEHGLVLQREQNGWQRKKWLENHLLTLIPWVERNLLVKVYFLSSSYRSYQLQLYIYETVETARFFFFTLYFWGSLSSAHKELSPAWQTLLLFSCPPDTPGSEKNGSLESVLFLSFMQLGWWSSIAPWDTNREVVTPPFAASAPGYVSHFAKTLSHQY